MRKFGALLLLVQLALPAAARPDRQTGARPGELSLAYATDDGKLLPARLAPFYLVWKDAPDSNSHRKWGRFWPRQVVSIDLVSKAAKP